MASFSARTASKPGAEPRAAALPEALPKPRLRQAQRADLELFGGGSRGEPLDVAAFARSSRREVRIRVPFCL